MKTINIIIYNLVPCLSFILYLMTSQVMGQNCIGNEISLSDIFYYGNGNYELLVYAQAEQPVSAIQFVIESNYFIFDPPADSMDLLKATDLSGMDAMGHPIVEKVVFRQEKQYLSVGIFMDYEQPFEGKAFSLCPNKVVARLKFRDPANDTLNIQTGYDGFVLITGIGSPAQYCAFTTRTGNDVIPNIDNSFILRIIHGKGVQPSRGGNTGMVTITIYGYGFQEGSKVELCKLSPPDSFQCLAGQNERIGLGGLSITVSFDLSNQNAGLYDVIIWSPKSQASILKDAFTIEDGIEPHVWIEYIGRRILRPGQEQYCVINVWNNGNVDAHGIILWIMKPLKAIMWSAFEVKYIEMPEIDQYPLNVRIDGVQSGELIGDNESILTIIIPVIQANIPISFLFKLKSDPSQSDLVIQSWVSPPFFGSPLKDWAKNTYDKYLIFRDKYNIDVDFNKLAEDRWKKTQEYSNNLGDYGESDQRTIDSEKQKNELTKQFTGDAGIELTKIAIDVTSTTNGIIEDFQAKNLVEFIYNKWVDATKDMIVDKIKNPEKALNFMNKYKKEIIDEVKNFPKDWKQDLNMIFFRSRDPNQKFGPFGAGGAFNYISTTRKMSYSVFFENTEDASGQAQEVIVTDQLDKEKLDLSTIQFGPISVGDSHITPYPGLPEFTGEIDFRPEKNIIVKIDARLNTDSGLLTWHFKSIDPITGELPEDPLLGFLPANVRRCSKDPTKICSKHCSSDSTRVCIDPADDPQAELCPNGGTCEETPCGDDGECIGNGEGEGSVFYTIMPKAGLPTGTEIKNQATIIFDQNEPITTDACPSPNQHDKCPWLNTIDSDSPKSKVKDLPATTTKADIAIEWYGTDIGAGILDYSVFVSEDGRPYTILISNTTEPKTMFTGQIGKSYCFYSVARDQVGNVQEGPFKSVCTEIIFSVPFKRGDEDASGRIDITDPVNLLTFLFLGGEQPPCKDAADSDDSGQLDVTDAIYVLNWLFLGAEMPLNPGPFNCGPDPTDDGLPACVYDSVRC